MAYLLKLGTFAARSPLSSVFASSSYLRSTITSTVQIRSALLSSLATVERYHHRNNTSINIINIMEDTTAPSPAVIDMEELMHQAALQQGQITYHDPSTGFTVFTELSHLKRGTCCGNKCRHCPYGYENVKPSKMTLEMRNRVPKLRSGDKETAKAMMQQILAQSVDVSPTGSTTNINGNGRSKTSTTRGMSTSKNVPYTRRGDTGTSQLGTGERRSKDDCNFESLGTVDELCSVVGVVHAHLEAAAASDKNKFGNLPTWLLDVMSRLFDLGSHVAKPRDPGTIDFTANGIGDGFDAQHTQDLEAWINEMTEALPELTSFILPTGAPAAAHLHVARTVCRRAERRIVPLVIDEQTCDPNAMKYLNRLSDFFFVAARWVNFCEGQPEIQYQRDTPHTTQRQRVARSLQHED